MRDDSSSPGSGQQDPASREAQALKEEAEREERQKALSANRDEAFTAGPEFDVLYIPEGLVLKSEYLPGRLQPPALPGETPAPPPLIHARVVCRTPWAQLSRLDGER